MILYANYDHAGTNRFVSHVLNDDEMRTMCGLYVSERRGSWEATGAELRYENIGCERCKRAYASWYLKNHPIPETR